MLEQELANLFGIISEAANLQPAVITMNRGTIIEADHTRKIGKTLFVGIGYNANPETKQILGYNQMKGFFGAVVNRLPDFVQTFYSENHYNMYTGEPNSVYRYEKSGDELDMERYQKLVELNAPRIILDNERYKKIKLGPGGYSAHKTLSYKRFFGHILTINIDNIASIEQE